MFLILASAVAVYGFGARRIGKWALVAFVVAWLGLLVNYGALSLVEHNSPAVVLRHLAPAATIAIAVTVAATLFAARAGSLRGTLVYGISGAAVAAYVLPLVALLVALTIPRHFPCMLPSLQSPVQIRTITEVPTSGFYSDTCPVPLARELELTRTYGSIRMRWWGSPHRLYMVGEGRDGPLTIRGPRVEPFGPDLPDSPLAGFTSRITFAGETYVLGGTSETVAIQVLRENQPLEQLELQYAPQPCTCVAYDVP